MAKKGKNPRPPTDDKWSAILAAMEEERKRERAAFRGTVDQFRAAPPIARAEACLRFWAERLKQWGDHEAVVYFMSRGNDCSSIIREMQFNWRAAEKDSIDRLIGKDIADKQIANTIRQHPTRYMFRFWGLFDRQELSIDATMLRTMQWCNILGYEQWWRRLERDIKEGAFSGGANPFLLFNYCRADHAVRNMTQALQVALDSIDALSSPPSKPWFRGDGNLEYAIHEAAAIVFAHARVRKGQDTPSYVEEAVEDLRKYFDYQKGAWPAFSGQPTRLSVESTAMALHALYLAKVRDWDQFARPARSWLLSQQDADGYWFEPAAPDAVWLTVLVLDSIELASGGTKLTFDVGASAAASTLVFVAYQHSDSKWLEELKKHLGGLVHSGAIEFFDDRQIGAGKEWNPEIKSKLMTAKVIIPLLSPNFLGSKYIQTVELPTAIERHRDGDVTVLPVLVEECDWQGLGSQGFSLEQINVLPKDKQNDLKPLRAWKSERHEAWTQIAREVRRLVQRA
jgi:hypothetical protein